MSQGGVADGLVPGAFPLGVGDVVADEAVPFTSGGNPAEQGRCLTFPRELGELVDGADEQ